jgi:hypothetical protein
MTSAPGGRERRSTRWLAMAVSGVMPRLGSTALNAGRQASAGGVIESDPANSVVALATTGLLAYVLLTASWFVQVFVTLRSGPSSHELADIVGLALCLPILLGLVLIAVRDGATLATGWLLVGLVLAFSAVVPAGGVAWLFFAQFVAGAVLVALPLRRGLPLFLVSVLLPLPVVRAEHQASWSTYMCLKTLQGGLCLAVLVVLARTLRQAKLARVELARQAVIAERLRIGGALAADLSHALERIAADGEAALAGGDNARLADVLAQLVPYSREALANARRQLAGYQEVSARDELQTAVTLLRGAGVRARLALPDSGLPAVLDGRLRVELRAALADVLARDDVTECVLTLSSSSADEGHQLSVSVRPDEVSVLP